MSSSRYVFVDLDALNHDTRAYLQTRKSEFSNEELSTQWPLDPVKLTRFLSVSNGMCSLFGGVCDGLMDEDMEAFRAAGWDLQAKGRLRDLLYQTLTREEVRETKMMVLVGTELTESMLKYVRKYLEAGWSVQTYTFRTKGKKEVERLRLESPDKFHSVFLDHFVNFLLKDGDTLELPVPQTKTNTSSAATATGRYVFMNADAITHIFKGKNFYKKVSGATKVQDIRLNFGALTTLACGGDKTSVQRQVAVYGEANEYVVKQLQRRGWTMEKAGERVGATLLKMLEDLASLATSGTSRKLVLLIGTEAHSTRDREKWNRVIVDLVKKNWCIEVRFWGQSFRRGFVSSFKTYPKQITLVKLDEVADELLFLNQKARAANKSNKDTTSSPVVAPARTASYRSVSTGGKSKKKEEEEEKEEKEEKEEEEEEEKITLDEYLRRARKRSIVPQAVQPRRYSEFQQEQIPLIPLRREAHSFEVQQSTEEKDICNSLAGICILS